MKEIVVQIPTIKEVKQYEANDGKVFDTFEQCALYEQSLMGTDNISIFNLPCLAEDYTERLAAFIKNKEDFIRFVYSLSKKYDDYAASYMANYYRESYDNNWICFEWDYSGGCPSFTFTPLVEIKNEHEELIQSYQKFCNTIDGILKGE